MDFGSRVGRGIVAFEQLVSLLEGDNAWQTLADFPESSQFPKSVTNREVPPGSYLSDARLKLPSLSCQHSYAKTLGCPFRARSDRPAFTGSHYLVSLMGVS